MRISPAQRLRGRVQLPGDKSVSHRAAIIGALAESGRTRITNFSTSEDCASTLECLRGLGVSIERAGNTIEIAGGGAQKFHAPINPLDCGNSGSTMRMLAGVLAGQSFDATLTGDASLRARPMRRIIEPLRLMGARIDATDDRAPLHIRGSAALAPVTYSMPVASAQVKSCLLLAGLNATGRTTVIEKGRDTTRDHTERMLRWFGVNVETKVESNDRNHSRNQDNSDEDVDENLDAMVAKDAPFTVVSIEGPVRYAARDVSVPSDISSATFFVAAAALLPDSELELVGVGLNETRAQILRTMQALGASVSVGAVRLECNEEVGSVVVRGNARPLVPGRNNTQSVTDDQQPNVLRGATVAQLIDELPMLTVVGSQIEGGLSIRDARELRVKETDRISACVENLRRMGASVAEHEDGLTIAGPVRLRGARLEAYGDHRIAMAFSVAALIAEGESEIIGAECVGVSFPEFYTLLESVVER